MEKTVLNQDLLLMVVDDNEPVADLLSAILRSMGYGAISFCDGFDAVEGYRSAWKDIRLVILDINMPTLSGREVFSRLKEINPDVDVIFISGCNAKTEARSLLDAGARGFIEKPFTLDMIFESIGSVVGKRSECTIRNGY